MEELREHIGIQKARMSQDGNVLFPAVGSAYCEFYTKIVDWHSYVKVHTFSPDYFLNEAWRASE